MKIIPIIAISLIFSVLTLTAQNSDEITIPLKGDQDQWVKVDIKYGVIEVNGSERNDVHISWQKLEKVKKQTEERKDGLKKISSGESGLEIDQENHIIEVSSSSFTSGYKIMVEVPKKTNLDLSSFNHGDLAARNIEGEVTMHTYNGKINAHQMSGSVNANTFNGDIVVEFDQVTPDLPLEFITYNGDVDITLPASTKATLKMRTKGGEILTGFDIKMKKAEEIKSTKSGDTRKVFLDGWIYGDLNGGGVEFELENNWGNIYIRKN